MATHLRISRRLLLKTAGLALALCLMAAYALAAVPQHSCVACHSALEGELADPVRLLEGDVHSQAGLTCVDCHGGDPFDDSMNSMSPAKGFRGVPRKQQIPGFCARCHSDANYMRHFNPKIRTDQLSEYVTSVHGKRLKQDDTKVAACVDCHSVHNILPVSDTRSPVYPANVVGTCSRCHTDTTLMKNYKIPADQAEQYQKSMHAQALTQGDMSAPTCSTCHGSHGATPPGVDSVANVCGTCHVFFAQLFDKSPHKAAFAAKGFPGCVQCHSNHAVVHPTDEWVGVGAESICTACHTEGDAGYVSAKAIADDLSALVSHLNRAEDTLGKAERSGMEVSTPILEIAKARDALIKARVAVHTFRDEEVRKLTDQGIEIAKKSNEEGMAALRERDARRKGLGISLIFIVMAIAGLYLRIRQIERH